MDRLISIITINYNNAAGLRRTLESVRSQDFSDWEHVVVDGGSTDGSVEVMREFLADPEYAAHVAWWRSGPDGGIYDAMDRGLAASRGEWVQFLNSGDALHGSGTLSAVAPMLRGTGAGVVYGDAVAAGSGGPEYRPAPGRADGLARRPVYRHGASFVRGGLHRSLPFDLSLSGRLGFALDFHHMHRMWESGVAFEHAGVTVIDYEEGGVSDDARLQRRYNILVAHGTGIGGACALAADGALSAARALLGRGRRRP